MKTPILDFVREYAASNTMRMHMPGHKGKGELASLDITEIKGADSLYEADGIIKDSEAIASSIFGAPTYYSTEGSSLAIRAMLYLAYLYAKERGLSATVLAGRNAHKSLVSAAALIGIDIEWIYTDAGYMSCPVSRELLEKRFDEMQDMPMAVYITSPDYLGNMVDIASLAEVCHKRGVLLLVDNAHGAYLKFLSPSLFPIDLGADMCASSAHKTLPVLTGGAYLHIESSLVSALPLGVKDAMAQFGSTSPSYLILSSLDSVNAALSGEFANDLERLVKAVDELKNRLGRLGYTLVGEEKLKLTISAKDYGYLGTELAELVRERGVEPEFADCDYLVLMPSVASLSQLDRLAAVFGDIPRRELILADSPSVFIPPRAMSPREAFLSTSELVDIERAEGRVLSAVTVGCPPAVPILVSGEVVTKEAVDLFRYYGIDRVSVVK